MAVIIAGFGDSITAGQYIESGHTYLHKLEAIFSCETVNAGVPGNTSTQGLERMEQDVLAHRPDWCIVAFGMNDHVAHAPQQAKTSPDQFRRNLEEIVSRLNARGIKPVLCTISPIIEGDAQTYYYNRHPKEWYREPSGAQAWIDAYSEVIREVAASRGAALADIATAWSQYTEQGGRLDDLLRTVENSGIDDGVHPTEAGQAVYADCIADALRRCGL